MTAYTHQIPSLTLEAAQTAANAALAKAQEQGFKMNIVVCDHAGHPLVALRMPGAPLPAYDFARRKAATASYYGIPTADWKEKLESRPIVMTGLAQHDNVAMFGGGQPITMDGQVVGGIGVAGGNVVQDDECALAGLAALNG